MDDTFFQELDAHITNVGTNKCWKRKVGDLEIWFSPIPYTAQLKANETIANEDLGTGAVQETKRVALSHSIVGFDGFDLRKYRDAGPVFPMVITDRDGNGRKAQKTVKVDLPKYIYTKIAGWDSELVDVAFQIFADLMESNKRDSMKEVRFENAKDPMDELAEVEARASELRDQLSLPQMVEAADGDGDEEEVPGGGRAAASREDLEEDEPLDVPNVPPVEARPPQVQPAQKAGPAEQFDPFRTVPQQEPDHDPVRSVPIPEPVEGRRLSPIELELQKRGVIQPGHRSPPSADDRPGAPTSSPDRPYAATPSVDVGIIEQPGERKVVSPPKIDQKIVGQSRNPRFSPGNR